MASPDELGLVNYRQFAEKCTAQINEYFSVQSITTKADMLEAKYYVPPANFEQLSMTNLELFDVFRKYDRNQNGFLEINEYIQCLKDSGINLSEAEIVTLAMCSDINGDERIDFEEFMIHFQDFLKMVRFQNTLHSAYLEYVAKTTV